MDRRNVKQQVIDGARRRLQEAIAEHRERLEDLRSVTMDADLAETASQSEGRREAEVIVIFKGIDEGYMQHVYTRHSYRYDELVWGGRFVRAFTATKQGAMELFLEKLSQYEQVPLAERIPVAERAAG